MKSSPGRAPAIMIAAGVVAFTLTAGGGAIAGSLVTSAQIQDDTIRSADVKDGTLKLRDIAEAARAALAGQDGADGVDVATGPAGPTGPVGPAGPVGLTGPKGADGTDGTNGTDGTDGTDGTNGAPGSRWYQGTGVPAAATGVLGDWYVNTATSDVYEKTADSTWTLRLNIKGAGGTNGVSGWEIVSNSTDNVLLPIDAGFEASCPSGKVPLGGGSSVQLKNAAGGYLPSPWARPICGLEKIAEFWESERDGVDEEFTLSSNVVAADGDTAVVRVFVEYAAPGRGVGVIHGYCNLPRTGGARRSRSGPSLRINRMGTGRIGCHQSPRRRTRVASLIGATARNAAANEGSRPNAARTSWSALAWLTGLRVGDMDRLTSLTRERVVVESVDWTSKVVRTGGPSGPLHDEWALSVRVKCDAPARAVACLDLDGVRRHARDWARRAERVVDLRVLFFPADWEHTDKVQINTAAGGIRVQVESAAVKVDPVAATTLDVEPGMPGFTGVPIRILSIPDVGIALGVLLVRSTDTKADRTRWRVRDEHADGLGEFSFLSTGERGGQT